MDALPHAVPEAAPAPLSLSAPFRSPSLWQALSLLLLYFVLQLAVGVLGGFVLGLMLGVHGDVSDSAAAQAIARRPLILAINVMFTLAIAAGTVLWLARRIWPQAWLQALPPGFGFRRPRHAGDWALAVGLGLAMPVLGGLLTQWLAHGHAVPQDIRQLGENTPLLLRLPLALLVVTIGPMVEELLFRGALLGALLGYGRLPGSITLPTPARTFVAVFLMALLFGLVHLPDLGFFWYAVPNLVLLGAVLGWLRLHSQSLWPCIVAHGVNNLLAITAWFALVPAPG